MTDLTKTEVKRSVLPFLENTENQKMNNSHNNKITKLVRRELEQRNCHFLVCRSGSEEIPKQIQNYIQNNFEDQVEKLSKKFEYQLENVENKIDNYNKDVSDLYNDIIEKIEKSCVDGKINFERNIPFKILVYRDSGYSYHNTKSLSEKLRRKLKYITEVTNFFENQLKKKGYKSYIEKNTQRSSPDFEGDVSVTNRIFFVIEKI